MFYILMNEGGVLYNIKQCILYHTNTKRCTLLVCCRGLVGYVASLLCSDFVQVWGGSDGLLDWPGARTGLATVTEIHITH